MPFLDFLKSPISEAGKTLFSGIGDIISKFKADPTKVLEMEHELEKLKIQHEEAMARISVEAEAQYTKQIEAEEAAISDRWKADMASDSWLAKNVRPLSLVSVLAFLFIIIIIDSIGQPIDFTVKPEWVDLLKWLLITMVGAYFGGRTYEKMKKPKMIS